MPADDGWDPIVRAPKRFCCPVHDAIELHPVSVAFTNTSSFQRLKSLHQLGLAHEIFPGANHDRKEHSLGVAYLAREQAEHFQRLQGKELEMTDRDVLLVELAGLCHDLGHGPFSHVFERVFMPEALKTTIKWDHEEVGCDLVDYTIDKYHIDLADYGLDPDDSKIIKALMTGDREDAAATGEKKFLFDIVANKRNSIDVDKFDYLARDSLKTGVAIGTSTKRLRMMTRVIDDEICYKWSEFSNICQLFHERARMHQTVYSHRKGKAMEYMLVDAMLLVEPYLKLAEKATDQDRSQFVKYMRDEAVLHSIRCLDPQACEVPKHVEDAQALLQRMDQHKLYRYCDETTMRGDMVPPDPSEITSRMPPQEQQVCVVRPEDLIVREVVVDYAMKERNPLDCVHFFDERNCKTKFLMDPSKCTPLPANIDQFMERKLRVYCKLPVRGVEEAIKMGFRAWCEEKHGLGQTAFPTPLKISGTGSQSLSGARKRLRYTTAAAGGEHMDAIPEQGDVHMSPVPARR